MSEEIPWERLGIPPDLQPRLAPSADRATRLACARAPLPLAPDVYACALYVLTIGADPELRDAVVEAVRRIPKLEQALGQRTHAKVLEFLSEVVNEPAMNERIMQIHNTNDRTALAITRRADATLCDIIADNHERLLITPEVLVALHGNLACSEDALERATGWLRMNQALPPLPAQRGAPPPPPVFDLDAEVQAALAGQASPMLEARKRLEMFEVDPNAPPLTGFDFTFRDDDEFSLDLLEDRAEGRGPSDDEKLSLEKRVAALSIGKKIKLAFLGNKEVRAILIRDRSKMVAVAVVKGGRLTDNEVLSFSANRNLPSDVLREIAMNKEWMRKYAVQVALVNNPRCPVSLSIGIVARLQVKDLATLARNRNVPSVIFQMATKLQNEKSKNQKG